MPAPIDPPQAALTEQTFLPLYHATIGPLFRTAARHTAGNRTLAEDIVQETYLRALDTWPSRGIPDIPLAWLRTVALNLIRSHHRAAAPESITPSQLNEWLTDTSNPSAASESTESLVIWGLGQMHPDASHLIEAFHLDRRSLRQIATECGCSAKAIERRLSKARIQLRRILKPHVRPMRTVDHTPGTPHKTPTPGSPGTTETPGVTATGGLIHESQTQETNS